MAASTKASSKSSKSRNGSRAKSPGASKSAAAKRSSSSAKRTNSNGSRAKSKPANKTTGAAQRRAKSGSAPKSIANTTLDRTKTAGHAVADLASKAKTPLIAGATAIAGAAAGVVIKDRLAAKNSNGRLKRLRGLSIPNPAAKFDLSKLDLDSVKSAAERVSAYGQQASDIAAAVEKTQKKNS